MTASSPRAGSRRGPPASGPPASAGVFLIVPRLAAISGLLLLASLTLAQDSRPLANEKSPYLRQHLNNPVIWYPWGDEAFAKATRESKPIFLSIGYASCHWCHVMEKESFEDARIAAILNESYVPIKVDREERPDVDELYMHAAILMTGHGGWPLTLFLTPDKKPFFAGTYIPREDQPNHTGLVTMLASIREAWKQKRSTLVDSATRLDVAIRASQKPESAPLPANLLAAACGRLLEIEDKTYGGFGDSPKFPSPCDALALLRHHARTGSAAGLAAVRRQFVAMWHGGIHDHVGGGFHRYSTDRFWHVPHFEKMLYDEALIARVYLELAQAEPTQPAFEGLCLETLDFCRGTLRARGGGFIAALDATVNGEEGATYLWSLEKIEQVLETGPERAAFEAWAGLAQGTLHEAVDVERVATTTGQSVAEVRKSITAALARLLNARNKRPQPARVEHVITAWNALMVSTLARAGMILNKPAYRDAALETTEFLEAKLRQPDGLYARRITEGEVRFAGTLSDQAAVAEALLDLHEMTLDPKWLDRAGELVARIVTKFGRNDGSFDDSVEMDLIYRPRDLSDGATPSGVSQMNVALARLARLTGSPEDLARARRAIQAVLPDQAASPADHAYGAIAWDLAFQPVARVVFQGPKEIISLLRAPLLFAYRPHVVMTVTSPGNAPPNDERASAVVWIDGAPSQPLHDSASILQALERLNPRPESR